MNHTENYQLSQWEKSDRVLMEDFNNDNAKIDAAIKAEAGAREALAAQLATKGNCRIWTTTYVGNGTFGRNNPTVFTFPARPALFFIIDLKNPVPNVNNRIGGETCWTAWGADTIYSRSGGSGKHFPSWSGNSMSFYDGSAGGQFNDTGVTYMVVALIPVS